MTMETRRERHAREKHEYFVKCSKTAAATALAVALLCLAFAQDTAGQAAEKQTAAPQSIQMVQNIQTIEPPEQIGVENGAEETFTPYQIPESYTQNGGYLPELVQRFAFDVCKEYGIKYSVILAMIETESGYRREADDGQALGYMQVVPEFHENRMTHLQASDLSDPYQNIATGADYLAELLSLYDGNYEKALTAYNYGPTGAKKYLFSAGVYHSEYSDKVLEKAARIEREMGGAACE